MARNRLEKQARRILAQQGDTILTRLRPDSPEQFPLAYVRTGPRTTSPAVVLPGGPGLASVVPYRAFRERATRRDLDVIMVEHRGVGLSGRTVDGARLPREAVTIELAADDIIAVLDAVGAEQAVIAGSSYGTYLAQAVAVRHPERVKALVLDSPKLSVAGDLAAVREHRRRLLWSGDSPATARSAELVRRLAAEGEPLHTLGHIVQVTYEFAGPGILERLLRARLDGRLGWLWNRIARLGTGELEGAGLDFYLEPDAVAGISYGQLGYGLPPDGGPLDPQLTFAEAAGRQPRYAGEPFNLAAEVPAYRWPTVVVSGDRDLRTPRPVAERIAGLAPEGVLVPLAQTGHSALDTHQLAFTEILRATVGGGAEQLPAHNRQLSELPRKGASGLLGKALAFPVRLMTRPSP